MLRVTGLTRSTQTELTTEGAGPARRASRLLAPLLLTSALVLSGCATSPSGGGEATGGAQQSTTSSPTTAPSGSASEGTSGEGAQASESSRPQFPASNTTGLKPLTTVEHPDLQPKSVVSNQHGQVITNNMMYRHNVMLFDVASRKPVVTLSDTVDADKFELEGYSGKISGSPVEAVWTKDGRFAYVSQYQVADHGATAEDNCSNGSAIAPAFVYRYNAEQQDWDQVIQVGRVPKYVALSPDEASLLVSNWCDKSISVVDTASGKETKQIPLNSMPRGIVVMPDNKTAFVTAMYAHEVYRVDLETGKSEVFLKTGNRPRHLTLSPDATAMYLVVTGADQLLKLDPQTGKTLLSARTGNEPRTMTISADGTALYVVNYFAGTVSKFDAETLKELSTQRTGYHPIGVTYDAPSGEVWVANYGGSLSVYDDTDGAGPGSKDG